METGARQTYLQTFTAVLKSIEPAAVATFVVPILLNDMPPILDVSPACRGLAGLHSPWDSLH
jgi:hypothetical protein